jgi:hypothetical protein
VPDNHPKLQRVEIVREIVPSIQQRFLYRLLRALHSLESYFVSGINSGLHSLLTSHLLAFDRNP